MYKVAIFEKVSWEQFKKDWIKVRYPRYSNLNQNSKKLIEREILRIYNKIKLPKRATIGSAGYDFFIPSDLFLPANGSQKIPTGIRCKIEDGWVLKIYPRSSIGFKTGIHFPNTVGIIDSDYYNSNNEGHIFAKVVNDAVNASNRFFKSGEAFFQGIFVPFGITYDDKVNKIRNGGIGSTNK